MTTTITILAAPLSLSQRERRQQCWKISATKNRPTSGGVGMIVVVVVVVFWVVVGRDQTRYVELYGIVSMIVVGLGFAFVYPTLRTRVSVRSARAAAAPVTPSPPLRSTVSSWLVVDSRRLVVVVIVVVSYSGHKPPLVVVVVQPTNQPTTVKFLRTLAQQQQQELLL
jgi:Na+/melibiose symporter-like transporter